MQDEGIVRMFEEEKLYFRCQSREARAAAPTPLGLITPFGVL